MVRWIALAVLALVMSLLLPVPGWAQEPAPVLPPPAAQGGVEAGEPTRPADSDLLLRAGGPAEVGPGQRVGTAVVLGSDAIVQGTVTQDLVVLDGDATVSGEVLGSITVVNGRLDLGPSARVGEDVTLVQSQLTMAPGAEIAGEVTRSSGPAWGWGVGWFFWLSTSVFVILCGLLFAAIGGRQLADAATVQWRRPGLSVLSALALWVGVPALAVIAMLTVVGIPVGISLLVFVLPALWFLGYLVTGAGLGALIGRRRGRLGRTDHPYAAVALGLLVLQLVAFIPWIGAVVALLAGVWGAGGLALRAGRAVRGQPLEASAA